MNYVIEVLDGDIDSELIESEWTDEDTNLVYTNVFTLGSVCDFPENIEEGDTFQFSIKSQSLDQECAVCLAYSPTPEKSLQINVCN